MAIPSTATDKYREVLQAIIDHHSNRLHGVEDSTWQAVLSELEARAAAYSVIHQYQLLLDQLP